MQMINEVKAFVRFEREQVVTQPLALAEVHSRTGRVLPLRASLPLRQAAR